MLVFLFLGGLLTGSALAIVRGFLDITYAHALF